MYVIIIIIIRFCFCLGGAGGGAAGGADDCVVGFIRMDSEYLRKFGLCVVFNCKFGYLWNSCYVLFLIINLNICEIRVMYCF